MTNDLGPALAYLEGAQAILDRIRATQLDPIGRGSDLRRHDR